MRTCIVYDGMTGVFVGLVVDAIPGTYFIAPIPEVLNPLQGITPSWFYPCRMLRQPPVAASGISGGVDHHSVPSPEDAFAASHKLPNIRRDFAFWSCKIKLF